MELVEFLMQKQEKDLKLITKMKWSVIDMNEVYDKATKAWFNGHICQQTTVCKCEKCGLFYKPSLGHKCKAKE